MNISPEVLYQRVKKHFLENDFLNTVKQGSNRIQ